MRASPLATVTAVLVGAAALTMTAPVSLATSAWVGGGAIAVGVRDRAPTYAVSGVLMLSAVALVAVVWACLPGLLRGRIRPAIVALVGLAAMLAIAASGSWTVLVSAWVPRSAAVALVVAAIAAILLGMLRRPEQRGDPVRGVAPAVAGVLGAYVLVAAVTAAASPQIPQFPRPPWIPDVLVDAGPGVPITGVPAPQNPALAPGEWSTIHNDAWMTDTYSQGVLPDPASARVESFFAGGDCASLLWSAEGGIVAVCVSPTEVRAFVLSPGSLDVVAERRLADKPLAVDALTNFSGGGYAVLDAQQRLLTPLPGGVIARFDALTLDAIDSFDVAAALLPDEGITSVVPDWSGLLWFTGMEGTVGLLDPATGQARSLQSGASGPVDIENSLAVVEGGGAYVVTSEALLRLDAVQGSPVATWRLPYDRGERLKPGQTSRASGTTPTVFRGGDFVAITDNADPRMNVLVVDVRGAQPSMHCSVPVFGDGESATENSLIALGDSLVVENNYGYSVTAVAGGHSTVAGLARIDVADDGCSLAWSTSGVTVPSLVSKGVLGDGSVLTYSKETSVLGVDAWWFTAVSAQTGEVRWRRLAGVGPLLNNHYAAAYLGPDGSVYVGTISGIVGLISGP